MRILKIPIDKQLISIISHHRLRESRVIKNKKPYCYLLGSFFNVSKVSKCIFKLTGF